MAYVITVNTTAYTPEDLGVSSLAFSFLSMATDQLRLAIDNSLGDTHPFAVGTSVAVAKDGTTIFRGKVSTVRASADPGTHGLSVTVLGPWNELEKIVYKQPHKLLDRDTLELNTVYLSRVILSKDKTVSAEIAEIIAYAAGQGGADIASAPTVSGIAMSLPKDEQEGLSCAGAIMRLLRYVPDAVARFDYSVDPPRLTILRSETSSLSLAARDHFAIDLVALEDRCVDGVVVEIYRTHDRDGKSYNTIDRQCYPSSAGNGANVMCVPMELDGSSKSFERAQILTKKLPTALGTGEPDEECWAWLGEHSEELSQIAFADMPVDTAITFTTRQSTGEIDEESGEPVYDTLTDAAALAKFPREALSAIPWWVDEPAEGEVSVTVPEHAATDENGEWVLVPEAVYVFNITVCSKESGHFRRTTASTAAEVCPDGLAEALYNSWHRLFMEGEITLWDDGSTLPQVGDLVTGYKGEVEDAIALVQGVTLDSTDTIKLTIGPPEHLDAHDLIALLRNFRTRRPSWHAAAQDSGENDDGIETGSLPSTKAMEKVAKRTAPDTAAWKVAKRVISASDGSTTKPWCIFAPIWAVGTAQKTPSGYSASAWTALTVTSGTLYAYLTWTGTMADDGTVTWTPGDPKITNSLSDLPEDAEPSGTGSSATQGSKTVVVTLGTFGTDANGATTFSQIHTGVIVENLAIPTSAAATTTDEFTAAWTVRKRTVTTTSDDGTESSSEEWCIFAPVWSVGRNRLTPSGYSSVNWTQLDSTLASGTLYAYLTWTGTKDTTGNITWTRGTPAITNSTSDIPSDSDPSGSGSSAKDGSKTVVVPIGYFGTNGTFTQYHAGIIVEGGEPNPTTIPLALGPIYYNTSTKTFVQDLGRWSISSSGSASFTSVVTAAVSLSSITTTHDSDHTDGVLL